MQQHPVFRRLDLNKEETLSISMNVWFEPVQCYKLEWSSILCKPGCDSDHRTMQAICRQHQAKNIEETYSDFNRV